MSIDRADWHWASTEKLFREKYDEAYARFLEKFSSFPQSPF